MSEDPRGEVGQDIIDRMKIPVTVTADEAFEIYRKLDKPTIGATLQALHDAGHKVSLGTLTSWATKFDWMQRIQRPDQRLLVAPRALLSQLTEEGQYLTPEVMRGLQNRTALRIAHLIKHLKIEGVKDLETLVSVTERFQSLIDRKAAEVEAKPKRPEREPAANTIDLKAFKVRK